jgi:uncharacterized membrane protein (DUF106 family)
MNVIDIIVSWAFGRLFAVVAAIGLLAWALWYFLSSR